MTAAPRQGVSVKIPSPEADRPSWLRVGLVAVVGFALGVAWPRLTGVRFGPSAPAEATSAVAARAPEAPSAVASAAAPVASAAPAAPTASAAPTGAAPVITVSHAAILSCKTDAGESLKGKDCGGLAGLDPIVQTRLKRLAQAPAAAENPGKLNVILGLDFVGNRVTVESGKSSTVKDVDSLKAYIAGEVKAMSLKSIDHQNARYSVLYTINIAAPGSAAPSASGGASASTPTGTPTSTPTAATPELPEGTAAVAWEVAIVRDSPHTGEVVARLPRGSKVQLGSSEGGWYKIKYGPTFTSEGWVYRGAIGK